MGFQISDKAKKVFFGLIGVGLVLLVAGLFTQTKFLFPHLDEDHPNDLEVVSYAEDLDDYSEDLVALKEEVKNALGDGYIITISEGEHGHEAHKGGEHVEEGHEAKPSTHHGPRLLWNIHISKTSGASHDESAHDAGAHSEHGNSNIKHGHHDASPAALLAGMFESGTLALPDHGFRRFWSNLLINGFFFMGIALGAMFYIALHYATESGWGVVLLRIFESVAGAIPFGMVLLLIVFIAATLGFNSIYPWMDKDIVAHDALIQGKTGYLNPTFFWIRIACYFSLFFIFINWLKKTSKREDAEGGVDLHYKMYRKSAFFIVGFAVFSSTMSWDIIMSIDTHWFSTLFGWYTFSGMWLTGMITIMMVTIYLKSKGAVEFVNENHIHDVAKWVFALSFLWSYLWFSQFMLIWYSNIPEEVTYFEYRFDSYKYVFFTMFVVNFILPMVLFMSRDTKRSWPYLITISLIIFVGHWFDVFCMVMPGTLFEEWEFGMLEIGMFMASLGGFVLLIFNGLSKAPLIQKNHPFLEESKHHEF